MFLARFSIKNPILINLLTITILVVGFYTYLNLPRESDPEIPFNWVFVTTIYPGAAPEEVEQLITKPIEDAIEDIENINLITSSSDEGLSFISVKFEQSLKQSEFDKRFQDLRAEIDKVKLPDGAEDAEVLELKTSTWFPILSVVVSGELPEKELKAIADDLKDRINEISGISSVTLAGAREREIWVEVDPEGMDSLNLALSQVVGVLSAQNLNIPGGTISAGRSEYLLRTVGQFQNVEQIKNVIVHSYPSDDQVHIRDIAEVSDTYEEAKTISRLNGRPAITLNVTKKANTNTIALADQVKSLIKEYEMEHALHGIHLDITNDYSVYTKDTLSTLQSNALFGISFVMLSLWLFLGWRNALFVAVGMPVAFMATFIFIDVTGNTLNGGSLFGLVLVLGIVVDHAIVITENIYRHMQMGKSVHRAVMDGMQEVTAPVLSATLTTIAAFLPLMLMPGLIGAFLKIIPMVVTMALCASLAEALIILPSHLAEWSNPVHARRRDGRWFQKIITIYSRVLKGFLRRRYWAVAAVLLCVVAGASLIPLIGVEMFGEEDLGIFYVRVWMPAGTKLTETDRVLKQVEQVALTLPKNELDSVITTAGRLEEEDDVTTNTSVGQVIVGLVEAKYRDREVGEILADLRTRCQFLTGFERIEFARLSGGPPTGKAVEVKVKGKYFEQLEAIAEELKAELAQVPGVYDIGDDFLPGKEELRVQVDESRASLHGLSVFQIADAVRTAFHGAVATTYREGDEEIDVVVKFRDASESSIERVEAMKLATPMGTLIPLREVASLELARGYATIPRFEGERAITVSAEVDKNINQPVAVNRIIEEKFQNIGQRYPGYYLDFRGEFAEFNEAFSSLSQLFVLGIFIMYILLGAQFKSLLQPLIILFTIPFAFIGAMLGLLVNTSPFSIVTLYGMVALAGIVVNDSIVLIDFINVRRRSGVGKWRAIMEGGRLRLRPIVLTTLTTAFGLLPMAIGLGGSSEMWKPLANTIIWGLAMSTLLTLFIIPCLYAISDDLTPKRFRVKKRERLLDIDMDSRLQPELAD